MTTKIEWADVSWNPITGCTPISEGCKNCYAKRMAQRLKDRFGYPKDNPFKPGTFHPDKLKEPEYWKKPRRIFVVSMGDLFHRAVEDKYIEDVFRITQIADQHTYMFLTKRPERMTEMFYREDCTLDFNTDNIWCGISASNQDDLDRWLPTLLGIPEVKHFVSLEPLLKLVDFGSLRYHSHGIQGHRKLYLVIAGCEAINGKPGRPSKIDDFRSVRDQCADSGTPFFLKQMEIDGKVVKMPELDGVVHDGWPGE